MGGTLFFSANDGTHGQELWRSDGSAAGTSQVAQINMHTGSSNPVDFLPINGTVFFSASSELWGSNGTAAGTQMLSSVASGPSQLTNVGGTLFFSASDRTHGRELWLSNGTAAGTHIVADINAKPNPRGGDYGSYPLQPDQRGRDAVLPGHRRDARP